MDETCLIGSQITSAVFCHTTFQLGLKINNSNLFSALASYIYHLFTFWLLLSFPVQVAPHPATERRR